MRFERWRFADGAGVGRHCRLGALENLYPLHSSLSCFEHSFADGHSIWLSVFDLSKRMTDLLTFENGSGTKFLLAWPRRRASNRQAHVIHVLENICDVFDNDWCLSLAADSKLHSTSVSCLYARLMTGPTRRRGAWKKANCLPCFRERCWNEFVV